METSSVKSNWLKTIFQRMQVMFGPKRLSIAEAKQDLSENIIAIPEEFSFENVIETYTKYSIKSNGKLPKTVIDKCNNEEFSDDILLQKLEFATTWRKCASGNLADEADEIALPVCFSKEAKETYNKISKYSMLHLIKYGNIDTKEILDVTKNMEYKWSRQTARKLFKNANQAQILTDYYRLATPDAKEQKEKTLTTDQALYGLEI